MEYFTRPELLAWVILGTPILTIILLGLNIYLFLTVRKFAQTQSAIITDLDKVFNILMKHLSDIKSVVGNMRIESGNASNQVYNFGTHLNGIKTAILMLDPKAKVVEASRHDMASTPLVADKIEMPSESQTNAADFVAKAKKKNPQAHGDAVKDQVIKLLATGWTVNQISKDLKIGKSTIYKWRKELGQ